MVAIILIIVLYLLLFVVAAMRPSVSPLSHYELQRRAASKQPQAIQAKREALAAADSDSILRIIESILLVTIAICLIGTSGWVWGSVLAIATALGYGAIANRHFVRRVGGILLKKLQPSLLRVIDEAPVVFRVLRRPSLLDVPRHNRFDSRAELEHMLEQSHSILSEEQKQIVINALAFDDRRVQHIMTPKEQVDTVKASEFLGPLVLDELHKLGHSHLPVIKEDIDHVVGVLAIDELLSLGNKQSVTAEKAMNPSVVSVAPDDGLRDALTLFLQSHQPLLIVKESQGSMVGIVTLRDVLVALVGKLTPHHSEDEVRTYRA